MLTKYYGNTKYLADKVLIFIHTNENVSKQKVYKHSN